MPTKRAVRKNMTEMTRIIRDPRDATKDYFIPKTRAAELYTLALLSFDRTNQSYCTLTTDSKEVR